MTLQHFENSKLSPLPLPLEFTVPQRNPQKASKNKLLGLTPEVPWVDVASLETHTVLNNTILTIKSVAVFTVNLCEFNSPSLGLTLTLRWWKQRDQAYKANLGYTRACLKNQIK